MKPKTSPKAHFHGRRHETGRQPGFCVGDGRSPLSRDSNTPMGALWAFELGGNGAGEAG